jgi:hypothetical protein
MRYLALIHGELGCATKLINVWLTSVYLPKYKPAPFGSVDSLANIHQLMVSKSPTVRRIRLQAVKYVETVVPILMFRELKLL